MLSIITLCFYAEFRYTLNSIMLSVIIYRTISIILSVIVY
jgi:hypothetical protein